MVKGESVAYWMPSYLGEAIDLVGFIILHFFFQYQAEIIYGGDQLLSYIPVALFITINIIFHNATGKTTVVEHGLYRQDFKHHAEQSNQ